MLLKQYIEAITHLFFKPLPAVPGEMNEKALIPLSICGLGLSGEMAEAIEACEPYITALQNHRTNPAGLYASLGGATSDKPADLKKAEHDLIAEYGDVLWYVAAICYSLGYDIETLDKPLPTGNKPNAFVTIGTICDIINKAEWHGKAIDHFTMQVQIMTLLGILRRDAKTVGVALEDVAKANVDKLRRRYPQGFVEGGGIRS